MFEMYSYILRNVFFAVLMLVSKSWSKTHGEMCGDIRLVQQKGIISSPYYPILNPSKVYCTWHILSPPESTLKIHVKDFDIPDDPECDQPPCCRYNFIRLPVSGKVGAYEQICANLTQSLIVVSQNHTTIVFHYGSPISQHVRGFQLTYSIEKNVCGRDFPCKDGTCIPMSKRCDGLHHCPHGEDERSCPGASDCEYKCQTGDECYSSSQRCDGHSDCIDDSDESFCAEELCAYLSNKHLCRNRRCIDADLWCNGNDDCGDFSDEEACLKNSMITIAMMGALLGGLFLVLAVGCSLRFYSRRYSSSHNYQLRLSPPGVPRLRMPHSLSLPALIDNEFFHREPPPMYSAAIGNAGIPRRSRGNRSRSSVRRSNHAHRYTVAVPVPKPPSDSNLNHSCSLSSEDSLLSSSNVQVTNTDDSEQLISA